jgi:1-acyl-sn-glycerol-3-phosphate acyltransferase
MCSSSLLRRILWRAVLTCTGGMRHSGELPPGPCVLVANHCSHADTAALLAVVPARRRPVVAAAADYWFGSGAPGSSVHSAFRAITCRALCAAFPVRRGGGSADLMAAVAYLAAGHDVIIYPEGTRSRDGATGGFRSGAARLAEAAGVPLVPVGIAGTRDLLPPGGRLRRGKVGVLIGTALSPGPEGPGELIGRARAEVIRLSARAAAGAAVPGSRSLPRTLQQELSELHAGAKMTA